MAKNVIGIFKSIIDLLKPVFSVDITIDSDNNNLTSVSIRETRTASDIAEVGVSAGQDERIKFGSTDNLWLHIYANPLCVNIGKYYKCKVKGKTVVFWLGAEAVENKKYVQLYINEDQLKQQELMKPSKTICGKPSTGGVFSIPINEFTPKNSKQKVLEAALNKKLKTFLEDIFNDR